jgi:hypothetical protein
MAETLRSVLDLFPSCVFKRGALRMYSDEELVSDKNLATIDLIKLKNAAQSIKRHECIHALHFSHNSQSFGDVGEELHLDKSVQNERKENGIWVGVSYDKEKKAVTGTSFHPFAIVDELVNPRNTVGCRKKIQSDSLCTLYNLEITSNHGVIYFVSDYEFYSLFNFVKTESTVFNKNFGLLLFGSLQEVYVTSDLIEHQGLRLHIQNTIKARLQEFLECVQPHNFFELEYVFFGFKLIEEPISECTPNSLFVNEWKSRLTEVLKQHVVKVFHKYKHLLGDERQSHIEKKLFNEELHHH